MIFYELLFITQQKLMKWKANTMSASLKSVKVTSIYRFKVVLLIKQGEEEKQI